MLDTIKLRLIKEFKPLNETQFQTHFSIVLFDYLSSDFVCCTCKITCIKYYIYGT